MHDVSAVFSKFLAYNILEGHCPWQAQHLLTLEGDTCYLLHPVAPRIVNDVSYM